MFILTGHHVSEFTIILDGQTHCFAISKMISINYKYHQPFREYSSSAENFKSSTRDLVGLQLWRGAFLIADYICSHKASFENQVVLELAAGTGFTSIVAAKFARRVICSDLESIVPLIQSNFQQNSQHLPAQFLVKAIDFFQSDWKIELKDDLANIDVLLVADVVYTQEITQAFIETLKYILTNTLKPLKILISMEKRWWTNSQGQRYAPSYDHFIGHLHTTLNELNKPKIQHVPIETIQHHFSQYYTRNDDLILLQVTK